MPLKQEMKKYVVRNNIAMFILGEPPFSQLIEQGMDTCPNLANQLL